MEKYKIQRGFGHVETDMTSIDTHSPEECLALFLILGTNSIKFQMIGLRENHKTIVRYFANIFPSDKHQIEADVAKLVAEQGCKDILGVKYEEYIKNQEQLFEEINLFEQEMLN